MKIQEIRQKYPQYNNIDDETLSTAVYKKYYADKLSYDDFKSRVGLSSESIQKEVKPITQQSSAYTSDDMAALDPTQDSPFVITPEQRQKNEQRKMLQAVSDNPLYEIPIIGGLTRGAERVGEAGSEILARGVDALAGTAGINTGLTERSERVSEAKQRQFDDVSSPLAPVTQFTGEMIAGGGVSSASSVPMGIAKSIGVNSAIAPLTTPTEQKGLNNQDFLKEKAIQASISGVAGGVFEGGSKLWNKHGDKVVKLFYKTKGSKKNNSIDRAVTTFIDSIKGDLSYSSPKDVKRYKEVTKRILEKIKAQPELYDEKSITSALTRYTEMKNAGFDPDINDVMDYAFSGEASAMRGSSGDLVKRKVQEVDAQRDQQVNKMLDRVQEGGGGEVFDKDIIGQNISKSIKNKREAFREQVGEELQPLYYGAKYNPQEEAYDTVENIVNIGTRFNEVDVDNLAPVTPTIQRPSEFKQRTKYPVMSFLQGRVKRGGQFAKQLEAMDITPKSHPRLFGKNGQDSLDNIDASEFPELGSYGYISEDDLLDAISNEIHGEPIKLFPQNMSQSDVERLRKTEAKQREFDSLDSSRREGVPLDQFGNELPDQTRAYLAEDITEKKIENILNPKKSFKTSQSEALEVPTTKDMLGKAKTLYPDLRMQARPSYLKNSEYWNKKDLENLPLNSVENIHHARRIIDGIMKQEKSGGGVNTTLIADLQIQRQRLDNILKEDPKFAEADAIFENAMKKIESEDLNRFGSIIKAGANTNSFTGLLDNVFSEKTTVSQFKNIVQELEKNVEGVSNVKRGDILSSYISDVVGKLDNNENIDTIYNKLFKTETQKKKIAILAGGKDTPLYKQFENTMQAMKNLKQTKSFYRGSTTANKIEATEQSQALVNGLELIGALQGGILSKINYVMQKINNKIGVDENKLARQGQEVLFNFFVNPKHTEKNIKLIQSLSKATTPDEITKIIKEINPNLSRYISVGSAKLLNQGNQDNQGNQKLSREQILNQIKNDIFKGQNTSSKEVLDRIKNEIFNNSDIKVNSSKRMGDTSSIINNNLNIRATHSPYIKKYSRKNNVDPNLVASIIKKESNFNSRAESHVGAKGLMQIMPKTAKNPGFGVKPYDSTKSLYDVAENIRFGTDYISAMLKRYDGDIEAALIAYNAGAGNADKWLKAGRNYAVLPDRKQTEDYAKTILSNYEKIT